MAPKLASRFTPRARRQAFGLDFLEDRVQPNDTFGLGLSLLTGAGSAPLAAPEQPPALVREQPAQEITVAAAATASREWPELGQTEVVPALKFDAAVLESVFGASNVRPEGAFSAGAPAQPPRPQPADPVAASQAQYAGGAEGVTRVPRVGGGETWTPAPQAGQAYGGRVLALLAGVAKAEQGPGTRGPAFVTLNDGGTFATLNSFGYANEFLAGGDNVLFESGYFFSAGGSPEFLSEDACQILAPITADGPSHATSLVQCGSTYFYFDHTVYGSFQLWLTVGVAFGPVSCVYAYNDYDVADYTINQGSYQSGPDYQQIVVREQSNPGPKYLFADFYSDPDPAHWQQAEYPELYDQIDGYSGCGNLTDGPATFGPGDWTGAFQYNFQPGPEYHLWINAHYRSDATPFP